MSNKPVTGLSNDRFQTLNMVKKRAMDPTDMGRRAALFLSSFLVLGGCAGHPSTAKPAEPSPSLFVGPLEKSGARLIVWLTVDQMRGDYLEKYGDHFDRGGFEWLLERGRLFTDAHYGHAITETAPGHATLFTGTSPRTHGIIANEWLLDDGSEVASVTDDETVLVGPSAGGEVGRSPRRLLVPTIGDALKEQTRGDARVVSVSVKDRGAVLPGGSEGLAFWLGPRGFVTSSYYLREAPEWLSAHERAHPIASYLQDGWRLAQAEGRYGNPTTASPYASKQWSPGFVHEVATDATPADALSSSPFGDAAVLDLALSAISGEELGEDDIVDLLAISLSSTDKIGHHYGPESREFEDQLIRLDTGLGVFFEKLTAQIPAERLIIVLSSDHGGCESAEYLLSQGKKGFRLTEDAVERATRVALRRAKYPASFLSAVVSPYVYLNRRSIAKVGADLAEVRRKIAESLSLVEGVHLAHVVGQPAPDGELGRRLVEAIHPKRSGDLYIVPERDTLFLQSESLGATHGSPWDYDTHVPMLLVGPGVEPGTSTAAVDVRSLVPTLAKLIGIVSPPRADAPPLKVTDENP